MSSGKSEAKTVKVKLTQPHRHAGMQYDSGMEIDVMEHDANWLKNLKIAEDVKNTSVIPKTAEEK
ncbi:hypothetical protein [Acinetobacter guillouiae]|uniref:DUF7210 family protein n=1 Tax=Acinetobacter guillouiae TaxID=106649 RepID=UPI0028D829CA|nr:hypothetical protein [Acinetobacter guillouiae]